MALDIPRSEIFPPASEHENMLGDAFAAKATVFSHQPQVPPPGLNQV